MRTLTFTTAFAALFLSGTALAQVSVPNTFTAGAPARAADVNANFQALVTAINGLGARVSKLEGNIVSSDLVGTYTLKRFQSELGGGASERVAIYTSGGTVALATDGSVTLSGITELGHQLNLPSGTLTAINRPQPAGTATWSYSGGTVTAFGQSFAVANGGRLLIATSVNPADGTNVLLLLTRAN